MMHYTCVIFDLDGTLIDSHDYTFAAVRQALRPYGRAPSDAEIYAAFGPAERQIFERWLPPEQVDDAYAALLGYYRRHVADLEVRDDVRALLEECKTEGMRLGLFTGRGRDSTGLILQHHDLDGFFDAVVAGDSVARPKPAPDGVRELCRALGSAPARSLVVGDSLLDVQAAAAAGADAILATWHARGASRVDSTAPCAAQPDVVRSKLGLSPR